MVSARMTSICPRGPTRLLHRKLLLQLAWRGLEGGCILKVRILILYQRAMQAIQSDPPSALSLLTAFAYGLLNNFGTNGVRLAYAS